MTEGTLFDNHAHRQTYKGEATFVSEYGGIQWSQDESGWGYGTGPKTEEEFLMRFKALQTHCLITVKCSVFATRS